MRLGCARFVPGPAWSRGCWFTFWPALEERVVVVGVLTRLRYVVRQRQATTRRGGDGRRAAALVLGGVQLCFETVLLALELSDDVVLLLLRGLEVALLALESLARLPE